MPSARSAIKTPLRAATVERLRNQHRTRHRLQASHQGYRPTLRQPPRKHRLQSSMATRRVTTQRRRNSRRRRMPRQPVRTPTVGRTRTRNRFVRTTKLWPTRRLSMHPSQRLPYRAVLPDRQHRRKCRVQRWRRRRQRRARLMHRRRQCRRSRTLGTRQRSPRMRLSQVCHRPLMGRQQRKTPCRNHQPRRMMTRRTAIREWTGSVPRKGKAAAMPRTWTLMPARAARRVEMDRRQCPLRRPIRERRRSPPPLGKHRNPRMRSQRRSR